VRDELREEVREEVREESVKGTLAVLLTYAMWGLMPIYWKMLSSVPPIEILGHRAIWGCVFSLFLLTLTRGMGSVASLFRVNRGSVGLLACS
jgi:chloramphenicol-sensitive protein RarD